MMRRPCVLLLEQSVGWGERDTGRVTPAKIAVAVPPARLGHLDNVG